MFSAKNWKNTILSIVFFLGLIAIAHVIYEWYSSKAGVLDVKIENAIQAKKIIKTQENKEYKQLDSLQNSQKETEKDIYKSVKEFYKQKEINLKKAKQNEKTINLLVIDTGRTYQYLSNYKYIPVF